MPLGRLEIDLNLFYQMKTLLIFCRSSLRVSGIVYIVRANFVGCFAETHAKGMAMKILPRQH